MKNSLASWTIAHFAVDMSCLYVLYRGVVNLYIAVNWAYLHNLMIAAFVLYNVLAFGLQSVLGALSDRFPILEKILGIEGVDLMLIPLIIIWISRGTAASWTAMVLAALFNAAFHVGAGINVLRTSQGKIAPSGIFVSSGALGVVTGTIYGSTEHGSLLPILIVSVAVILVYFTTDNWAKDLVLYTNRGNTGDRISPPIREYIHFDLVETQTVTVIVFLFLAIFIRSFAGFMWPLGFEKDGFLILVPAVSACLGKALGGMIADRIGPLETALGSLVISALLLMVGVGFWPVIGLSILFFNMAMPITLCGLVSAMPYNMGFAFGMSTLALLLGYLSYIPETSLKLNPIYTCALLCVFSAVFIYYSLKGLKKR